MKTHSGVHSEFARLHRDEPKLANASHAFLALAYRYKQEGDYGVGAFDIITLDTAKTAIEKAEIFIDTIATSFRSR